MSEFFETEIKEIKKRFHVVFTGGERGIERQRRKTEKGGKERLWYKEERESERNERREKNGKERIMERTKREEGEMEREEKEKEWETGRDKGKRRRIEIIKAEKY